MKLHMYPVSLNGNKLAKDQFGYALRVGMGFNPEGVDAIQFHCRGGLNRICDIELTLGPPGDSDGRRRWNWDGNMAAPTLNPSIGCDGRGIGCTWHGHIQRGEFTP